MTEIISNDFYNCIHGYIYSIPEHNVYLHKCNAQEECNCVNCPNFIPKIIVRPIEKIKKKCLCCGKEMELFVYEDRDFCDRCFYIVCQEVFNKENDRMTVEEVKERIRRIIENDGRKI